MGTFRSAAALTLLSAAFCFLSGQTVSVQCDGNTGVPPVVRQAGITELMSDIVLSCLGSGVGSFTADLSFQFDFPVTSRNYNPGTEAVLLIDEPGAPRPDDNGYCCVAGTPLTPGTNLFSADVSTGSVIRFNNVRFSFPKAGRPLTLRLVNVRGDMTGYPLVTSGPLAGMPSVSVSAPGVTFTSTSLNVGYVQQGLFASVRLPAGGVPADTCSTKNTSLAVNAAATGGTVDFAVELKEAFQTAFKVKNYAPAQNMPGAVLPAESGFFDTSLPPQNGYNRLGLADMASRLSLAFSNIPANARVYVTTGAVPSGSSTDPGGIRLVRTDGSPEAATTTASWEGSTYGIAPISVVNGVGVAEWEFLKQDWATLETYRVGILLAYPPGTVAAATPQVRASFGPLGGSTVPRFGTVGATLMSLPAGPCMSGVDLTITNATFPGTQINAGTSQPVQATIINRGSTASGPFQYVFQLLDMTTGGTEKVRYSGSIDGLQPGEGRTINAHVRIPLANLGGKFTPRLTADLAGATTDVNRSNNSMDGAETYVSCSFGGLGSIAASSGVSTSAQYLDVPGVNLNKCPITFTTLPDWLTAPWANSAFVYVVRNQTGNTRSASVCYSNYNSSLRSCQQAVQSYADPTCSYGFAGASSLGIAPAAGEVRRYAIQTGAGCKWTAVSNTRMAAPDGDLFTGSQSFNVIVRPNFGTTARSIPLIAGNWTGTIVQAANTRPLNERLVQLIYYYFLGRLPSDADLAFQAGALNGVDIEDFMPRFLNALEFDINSRYVAGLYVGLLARNAEFNGFLWQRSALLGGAASNAQLVDNFLNALEWKLRFGAPDNGGFVRLLYQNVLLRAPTEAEVAFHAGNLANGQTRTQLASNFLNSSEFRIGTGPNLTAFLLYAAVLGRDTVGTEFDDLVKRLKGGLSARDAMTELIGSPEFAAIVE